MICCLLRSTLVLFALGTVVRGGTVAVYWDQTGTHSLGGVNASAYAINNSNWIVGQSAGHATLWRNGQMIDLGVLPGDDQSVAVGVNDADQIAGYSQLGGSHQRFFLYDATGMHNLGPGLATGINDAGQIVGYGSPFGSFLWANGSSTPITAPTNFIPLGINNSGQMAGYVFTAYVVKGSSVVPIPLLPGETQNFADHINDVGQVVGASCCVGFGGFDRAFIWSGGAPVPIGFFDPWWINNQGEVVGSARLEPGRYAAVEWQNGTVTQLDGPFGGILTQAFSVNDLGVVVGTADAPEPGTAILISVGILALILVRLRRTDTFACRPCNLRLE